MPSRFALLAIAALIGFGALSAGAVSGFTTGANTVPVSVSLTPAARIKAGEIHCPHCDLSGADLSHQCVKNGDLTGANLDRVNARYMCMSFATLAGASLREADLTGANLAQSDLRGADLSGAKLSIASIKGADLSTAKGLTQDQLDLACGDSQTKLPAGLHAKSCV